MFVCSCNSQNFEQRISDRFIWSVHSNAAWALLFTVLGISRFWRWDTEAKLTPQSSDFILLISKCKDSPRSSIFITWIQFRSSLIHSAEFFFSFWIPGFENYWCFPYPVNCCSLSPSNDQRSGFLEVDNVFKLLAFSCGVIHFYFFRIEKCWRV